MAARLAKRHKSRRPDVEDWWLRRESALLRLSAALSSGTWEPGGYRFFEIHRPKRRWIAAAPFEDRVVHHALCRRLQPLLERRFLARSFSCQVGKGTTAARECCRRLVNRHRHVLKCDVSKFFHQIDHAILLEKLSRELRCPGVLALCRKILASFRTGAEPPPRLFPGDDWVAVVARPRGLPIGNLTSQLWGNFYLDGLDHRVAEAEGHGAYLRYTDDFLLFGDGPAPRAPCHRGGGARGPAAAPRRTQKPSARLPGGRAFLRLSLSPGPAAPRARRDEAAFHPAAARPEERRRGFAAHRGRGFRVVSVQPGRQHRGPATDLVAPALWIGSRLRWAGRISGGTGILPVCDRDPSGPEKHRQDACAPHLVRPRPSAL